MPIKRSPELLSEIVHDLRKLPAEAEWVEFKHNNDNPEEIGEYISALSNSAAFFGKTNAWMVWGIDNETHAILGTSFAPETAKRGGEALENWLLRLLNPKISFYFHSILIEEKRIVLMEICPAVRHPTQFSGAEYIRIGSHKKKLKDFPDKERELWRVLDHVRFEQEVAADNVSSDEVLRLLDYPAYYGLLKLPLPESNMEILTTLEDEDFIRSGNGGHWDILNLGAILFAKRLEDFRSLKRKAIRVVLYKGNL